jgi:hypothetical protein
MSPNSKIGLSAGKAVTSPAAQPSIDTAVMQPSDRLKKHQAFTPDWKDEIV